MGSARGPAWPLRRWVRWAATAAGTHMPRTGAGLSAPPPRAGAGAGRRPGDGVQASWDEAALDWRV
jgi:hypothetical protein